MLIRGDHFRFDFVFIKKSNQTEILFLKKKQKPNRNRVKPTGFGSVWFFRAKTGSNRLARFFWFWLGFFSFGSVFSVWLGFFPVFFGFGSVRFGFLFIKPKPNRTGRFFQNFNRINRFFFSVRFFRLFFFRFSRFNRFFSFFPHP